MDAYLYPQNPNPTYTHDPNPNYTQDSPILQDFFTYEDGLEQDFWSMYAYNSDYVTNDGVIVPTDVTPDISKIEYENGVKKNKADHAGSRVAIRTKSDLEVMDDGFKWRKYGKKKVKNSPNPRNYYKCASGGCNVKKRVERDGVDPSYVMTTYDGVHNHESPSVIYYSTTTTTPLMAPHAWSLQPASTNSSSHSSPT